MGRWCRFPGHADEACLLQLSDAGRDEPEAVLLGGFVVEFDRVACVQGMVAVHLDCAEMHPCVEAVWQIGRGNGPPALIRLEELDRPVRHDSRIAGQPLCGKWFPDGATLIDWTSARSARAYQRHALICRRQNVGRMVMVVAAASKRFRGLCVRQSLPALMRA